MTGSLQIKNNKYYVVLNVYEDNNGKLKRKAKWISTGLTVKGNKTRAQKILRETLAEYEQREADEAERRQHENDPSNMLLIDAVQQWFDSKTKVDEVTRQGYETLINSHIKPYFASKKTKLNEVDKDLLQAFINQKAKSGRLDGKGGLAPRSLKLLKNVLTQTLDKCVAEKIIPNNPCQFVELPTCERYQSNYYTTEQIDTLLGAIKDEPLYPLVRVTSVYGLRRRLRWCSVNFVNDTITIEHTIAKVKTVIAKDKTKNKTSRRTLPMTPEIKSLLQSLKSQQGENKEAYGNTYNDNDYVFVWEDGRPYSPDYVSRTFSHLLQKYGMPHIRLHDLRHSVASNLLNANYQLSDVSSYLGHSSIKTTADIYGHLDNRRKLGMAEALSGHSV